MDKQALINKLNRLDLAGVGAVVRWKDGATTYNFYEDFGNDKGIDRAARQHETLINAGKVVRVDYIYKDNNEVHFFDWDSKPGNFTVSSEIHKYFRCHNIENFERYGAKIAIINGRQYKADYTPAINGICAITLTKI